MSTLLPAPPQITITNATTLGYRRSLETFGGDITFKIVDEIRLSLLVSDIDNDGSIIGDISVLFDIQNSEDWSYLVINGDDYGRAKLTSFSLPEGNFAKTATCEVTFIINEDGDDLATLGTNYEDYNVALVDKPFIDSISESINLDIGENTISYNKQISVKFSDSVQTITNEKGPIAVAQDFAKKIFDRDASNSYDHIPVYDIDSGISALLVSGYRKLHSETINITTNECSFSESIQASNVITTDASSHDYSHLATQKIQINNFGIATVTESGVIKGLIQTESQTVLATATLAYADERENAKTRVAALFAKIAECEADNGLNEDALGVRFISESRVIKQEEGIIEYELTANNDPAHNSGSSDVIYERTITISKDSGHESAEENGTITGMSKIKFNPEEKDLNKYVKYLQAKTYFVGTIIGDIKTRLDAEVPDLCEHPISRTETHSLFQGQLTYTHTYSAAPEFQENDQYKTFTVSERTQKATNKFNTFEVINYNKGGKILIQDLEGKTQGNSSTTVNIVGYRKNPSSDKMADNVEELLGFATAKVSTTSDHISSANYSLSNYNEVRINLAVSYITELEEAIL